MNSYIMLSSLGLAINKETRMLHLIGSDGKGSEVQKKPLCHMFSKDANWIQHADTDEIWFVVEMLANPT